jgi:competence protein ComEC
MALAYSLFSGWGIPAQRTCLMLATVGGLRLLGARWPWPHVWMLACAVVVACDPWALMQAGFWLSFVAVGILFATDAPDHKPTQSTPARNGKKLAIRIFGEMRTGLRTQWVITVALSPLTLLLFGQMSLVGLVANAFAVPWVTLVVTPIALLGVLVPSLWQLAALTCDWLMGLLQYLAALPWATLTLPAAPCGRVLWVWWAVSYWWAACPGICA